MQKYKMADRKQTPYSTFNNYNSLEKKEQPKMSPQMQQMPQMPQMQQMPQMPQQMQQMQQMPQQMQQMQQMPQQMQQMQQMPQQMQQQMQKPSRFKHLQTPEHLHNVLTNGVTQFKNNFAAKGMNPPPMRVFLKLYTEWCTPCKNIAPILDEISLSEQMKDVIFMKFDADLIIKSQAPLCKQLVNTLKIGAVPAFYGFIDGKLVDSVMGADQTEINQLLQKIAN